MMRSFISLWSSRNEEHQHLSYFEDSIYIYYNGSSGTAIVNIGNQTGLSVDDLESVQAAFKPAENKSDYSGFAAGIADLDKALSPDPISTIVFASLAVVIVLAAIAYIVTKKHKK